MTDIRITGGGKGNTADVTSGNRLKTDAETNLTSHFVSLRDGKAFNWTFVDPTSAAGEKVAYLKNTSKTDDLFIDIARCSAASAAKWRIVSVTGTASGTTVTGSNVNLSSGVSAEATAVGDGPVTGLTEDRLITTVRSTASLPVSIPFDDILILGTDNAVAVEFTEGTTGGTEVFFRGYYQERGTD